jgi:hypothetical protein
MDAQTLIQLLGIIATVFVAWWTLSRTFANDRKKRKEEEAQKVTSFLGALRTEVTTLWPIYMEQFGNSLDTLKPSGLPGHFPVGEHYFTVYESNANLLGLIPTPSLRDQIVRTYIVANGMLDTIRLYNRLLGQAEQHYGIHQIGSNEARQGEKRYQIARDYATQMKTQHERLKLEVDELKAALEKFENDQADNAYVEAQKTEW